MDISEVFNEEHTELLKKAGYDAIEDLYGVSANQIRKIPWMRHSSVDGIIWHVTEVIVAGKKGSGMKTLDQIAISYDEIKDDLLGGITPQMIAEKMKEKEE